MIIISMPSEQSAMVMDFYLRCAALDSGTELLVMIKYVNE